MPFAECGFGEKAYLGASRGVIFNLGFLLQDEDNDDEIDDADYEDTFFATLVVSMAL